MKKERLEYLSFLFICIISGGFLLVLGFRYVLPLILPFLLAWLIAMATRSPSERLAAQVKVPKRIIRLFISLISLGIFFTAASVGIWQGAMALWRFLVDLGEGGLSDTIDALMGAPLASRLGIGGEIYRYLESAVSQMLSRLISSLADVISSFVGFVPKALFFLLITVIALIYFALDLENINAWVRSVLPQKISDRIVGIKSKIADVVKKYIRSYLILMLISFSIVLTGLLLLGSEHAFIISVILALLDLLPIIGVGTVLVPWSVISFISGDPKYGIGLLVLFAVNAVVRQLVEPKILGHSLDMHPVLTLALLYGGYSLLGFVGVLLVPVFSIVIGAFVSGRGSVSQ